MYYIACECQLEWTFEFNVPLTTTCRSWRRVECQLGSNILLTQVGHGGATSRLVILPEAQEERLVEQTTFVMRDCCTMIPVSSLFVCIYLFLSLSVRACLCVNVRTCTVARTR